MRTMSIELRDGLYYKAFLHLEFAVPKRGNILGAIYSDDPDRKEWHIVYRFRYYVDDKLGADSADTESWYAGKATGPEQDIFDSTVKAFKDMAAAMGGNLNVSVVESDKAQEQADKLMGMPGMNVCSIFGGVQPGSGGEN